jgi:hypothetical protein
MHSSIGDLITKLFVSMTVAVAVVPALAFAFPVEIDPGQYAHGYSVDGGEVITGVVWLELGPGLHEVDSGAFIDLPGLGSSRFVFTVTPDGRVADVRNAITGAVSRAAVASGNRLVFRETAIEIRPGRSPGNYFLQFRDPPLAGPQSLVLVPDLVYRVDEAPYVGAPDADLAAFYVVLDANGRIQAVRRATGEPSDSAAGSGTTLFFNR